MLDRVRVRALVEAGHAQAETAPRVGVSLSSVQRILHEGPIGGPQGGPTAKSRGARRRLRQRPVARANETEAEGTLTRSAVPCTMRNQTSGTPRRNLPWELRGAHG